jgi:hypothetical protein
MGMNTRGAPQDFLMVEQKSLHARDELLSTEISMWP